PGLDRAVCCFPASPTATSYALSLHDALPIYSRRLDPRSAGGRSGPVPRSAGGRSGPVPPLRRGPLGPCSPAPPGAARALVGYLRSEEHTSELQSQSNLVCRLLLEKKNNRYCY